MQHRPTSASLDLHAAGRLLGSYRWIEKQLFQVLGGWVTNVPEPAVKLFLDQQSFEFAWHADLWGDRLPEHRGIDVAGLTSPANAGIAAVFREMIDTSETTSTAEKLSGVYRVVLPRLVTAYSSHLDQGTNAGSDPTQRALRLILADELAAWRDGEIHLESLLNDPESIARAAEWQRGVETLLTSAGGISALSS